MKATGGLKRAALGVLALLSGVQGQTQRFCEGELGEVGWDCASVAPLPAQVGDISTMIVEARPMLLAAVSCVVEKSIMCRPRTLNSERTLVNPIRVSRSSNMPSLPIINRKVFDGQDELLPLPGTPDPLNPVLYQQISGSPMFDETGERTNAGGAAVYTLTAGGYWCMLAESNGEATLFGAPEGMAYSDSGT